MNTELIQINDWFRANKLCLDVKKTKYIIFSPSSNPNTGNHSLNIDNQNIDKIGNDLTTKSFKFLGLEIDECIAWKWHIDKICNKISRSIYAINKVKDILPQSCLKTLYESLIQCHINYGLEIWGSCSKSERVYKLQKRAIRIINKKIIQISH